MLRSEAAVGGVIRLSTVTEADVSRQVALADTAKHAQVGLEQREQTLGPIFMDVTSRVFLLGVIDKVMRIALHRPIATGGVGVELTPYLNGERLIHFAQSCHQDIDGVFY